MTGADAVIETRGLSRRFGDRVAVDGVDVRVRRGEIFGCLGPNGSGKSTLMRMILGLLAPSDGEATVLGCEIPRDAEKLRPAVGYMTQHFSLYEDLSVRENLEFAAAIFGLVGSQRAARVDAVVSEHALTPYAGSRAGALSGGWKQRLGLAAATVHQPELLVLDEPTAGVDPQSRREFWGKLFELAGAGTTVFVSTHYMDEAVRCHRLCMLRDGRRVALGSPADLADSVGSRVLDVVVEDPERAIAALADSPLVASTTRLGDTVHVLLAADAPDADRVAGRLERFLAEAGLPGARAESTAANLEDAFVARLLSDDREAAPTSSESAG